MAEGTATPAATGDEGHYFTIAELRAFDTEFSSATEYPDATIETARARAEARWERTFSVAFVSHAGETLTLVGNGETSIWLPRLDVTAVTAVTVAGVALTATELAALVVYPHGQVKRYGGWTRDATIVVTYTYGQSTVPEPVKVAVMLLAKEYLVSKNLSSRAVSESTDVGFIRLSIAREGKTGIPEVDAIGAEYGHGRVMDVG